MSYEQTLRIENTTRTMKQKIYSTLYGAIVGDAFGVPVEFLPREELKKNPVTDMRIYALFIFLKVHGRMILV